MAADAQLTCAQRRFPLWHHFLAAFLAAVFLLSGGLKAWDPGRFLLDVQAFQLVPYWAAYGTALVLPWYEVVLALGLLVPFTRPVSALALAPACLLFVAAILSAHFRGIHLDCGCFGEYFQFPNLWFHCLFNLALFSGLLMIAKDPKHPAAARNSPAGGPS